MKLPKPPKPMEVRTGETAEAKAKTEEELPKPVEPKPIEPTIPETPEPAEPITETTHAILRQKASRYGLRKLAKEEPETGEGLPPCPPPSYTRRYGRGASMKLGGCDDRPLGDGKGRKRVLVPNSYARAKWNLNLSHNRF